MARTFLDSGLRSLALALGLALAGCGGGAEPEPARSGWTAAFAPGENWLLSVWGSSGSDVYAVGGRQDAGLVQHFDGASWSPVDLGGAVPLINWVHGFGPDDVTIVGQQGTVLHFDGSSWSSQPTPTDQDLWGVWGAAPDDLWAVGGRGRMAGDATLLHNDGNGWQGVALPPLQRSGVNALFKVWGTSADNVYAVGQKGAVIHKSGAVWREELVGASDDLIAIWGSSSDHVVAVGGRSIGIASVWNGSGWQTRSLAPTPGLNGVWLRKPGAVHVVGVAGTVASLNSTDFSLIDESQPTSADVHGVFAVDGRLFAVGGNFNAVVPPYQGIAWTRELGASE